MVCGLPNCVTVTVSAGSYPSEVGWEVTRYAEVLASGIGGESADICLSNPSSSPTTTPSPTDTFEPTVECPADKECIPVSTYEELTEALSCSSGSCSWTGLGFNGGCGRFVTLQM